MAGDGGFAEALRDTASVELSYQRAIDGEQDGGSEEEDGEDEGGEDGEDQQDGEDAFGMGHHADDNDNDDMAWVDTCILNARRKGGRQTEMSVLKTYKVS